MKIMKAIKVFIYSIIASLLIFAFFGEDLLMLVKLISLSIALSAIYTIYLSKAHNFVNVGDEILAIGNLKYFMGKKGVALTRAKQNQKIKIKFYDGKEAEGIVEKTEGLFSPALVRIVYEEELIK